MPFILYSFLTVSVKVITEVRSGRNTDSFKICNSTHPEELCFSIIYIDGKDTRTLDLVAMTENDRKAWVEGLKALVREEGEKDGHVNITLHVHVHVTCVLETFMFDST